MGTPIYVNASTSLIQIDTSYLGPYIVLLSSLNAPGSLLTIRDSTGNAGPVSQGNYIVVSTTKDVTFIDGSTSNVITQPFGFLTITPKTKQLWGLVNTYAFPDASATANLSNLNVSSISISSIAHVQNALISTASISTITMNNAFVNAGISTLGNAFIGKDLDVSGNTTFRKNDHNSIVTNGGLWVKDKGISFKPVTGTDDIVNNSPWYGIGWANKSLGGGTESSVQVAGYSGINFVTGGSNESYGSDLAIFGNKVGILNTNPQATLDVSGTLSTTGQAAFYSSVQIQGGLSVFSTISAYSMNVATGISTTNIDLKGSITNNGNTIVNSSGNVSITGAFTAPNIDSSGGNVTISGIFTAPGFNSSSGNVTVTGAFSAPGINTSGNIGINATSNASYKLFVNGNQSNAGNLNISGTFLAAGINNTGTIGINAASNASYSLYVNGNQSNTGALSVSGAVNAASVTASGAVNAASVTASGAVNAASASVSGTVTAASFSGSGASLTGINAASITFPINTWINSSDNTNRLQYGNYSHSYYKTAASHIFRNNNDTDVVDFDSAGNITADGNITAFSDIRKKKNILTIDTALEKISKLRGVYYERNDSSERQIGLIAQEVEEVIPEVVLTDLSEDKFKSVAYGNIVALLIEGIKAQQSTIDFLLKKI